MRKAWALLCGVCETFVPSNVKRAVGSHGCKIARFCFNQLQSMRKIIGENWHTEEEGVVKVEKVPYMADG